MMTRTGSYYNAGLKSSKAQLAQDPPSSNASWDDVTCLNHVEESSVDWEVRLKLYFSTIVGNLGSCKLISLKRSRNTREQFCPFLHDPMLRKNGTEKWSELDKSIYKRTFLYRLYRYLCCPDVGPATINIRLKFWKNRDFKLQIMFKKLCTCNDDSNQENIDNNIKQILRGISYKVNNSTY